MDTIKKWIINYYLWIMLGFSILAIGFACASIYEAYKLFNIKNEPIIEKKIKIIKKSVENTKSNNLSKKEIDIKVIGGDTFKEILEKLENKKIISKNVLLNYLENNNINLEGIIFEGEYKIPMDSSPQEVISILTKPYEEWIINEYNNYKGINKSPLEIIIIASMIEKEAAIDEERPIIAGVIYNRLKNNMKLQIDATVIYALGEHKANLSYKDLKTKSPYNTYIIKGLPPGPICTPSQESIKAALNPIEHSYLYYVVSSYGSKKHNFAETYDEHLENVAKYKKTIK
ncbi:endolytic transglycosylase MltG [Defluviitalea phaphyphila]|uniref:endolytic transglycosylase MltG n=1 Tax=Defluviitalea phaphyphila TaxID=1473580 RepID=UPI000730D9C9|nr:endolytic transglycosylase MltG [Defluviitalea phaphyphila]